MSEIQIEYYKTLFGQCPYKNWYEDLPREAQARIAVRLRRVSLGNLGIAEPVGEGVHELKISFGPGYRVYFASQGNQVILLLCGSDKSNQ